MNNNADVVEYAARVKQTAAEIYGRRGDKVGLQCARVSLFETADVVAQLSGRERAVAILDQLASAILSEVPLRNLPPLALPAEPSAPPRSSARWSRATMFYAGFALGLAAAALVVEFGPLTAFLGFPLYPGAF